MQGTTKIFLFFVDSRVIFYYSLPSTFLSNIFEYTVAVVTGSFQHTVRLSLNAGACILNVEWHTVYIAEDTVNCQLHQRKERKVAGTVDTAAPHLESLLSHSENKGEASLWFMEPTSW